MAVGRQPRDESVQSAAASAKRRASSVVRGAALSCDQRLPLTRPCNYMQNASSYLPIIKQMDNEDVGTHSKQLFKGVFWESFSFM